MRGATRDAPQHAHASAPALSPRAPPSPLRPRHTSLAGALPVRTAAACWWAAPRAARAPTLPRPVRSRACG